MRDRDFWTLDSLMGLTMIHLTSAVRLANLKTCIQYMQQADKADLLK